MRLSEVHLNLDARENQSEQFTSNEADVSFFSDDSKTNALLDIEHTCVYKVGQSTLTRFPNTSNFSENSEVVPKSNFQSCNFVTFRPFDDQNLFLNTPKSNEKSIPDNVTNTSNSKAESHYKKFGFSSTPSCKDNPTLGSASQIRF